MTYEYSCTNNSCNHKWETQQKISEDPVKICPQCKHTSAKRLISGGISRGAILRGSGWYGTGGY